MWDFFHEMFHVRLGYAETHGRLCVVWLLHVVWQHSHLMWRRVDIMPHVVRSHTWQHVRVPQVLSEPISHPGRMWTGLEKFLPMFEHKYTHTASGCVFPDYYLYNRWKSSCHYNYGMYLRKRGVKINEKLKRIYKFHISSVCATVN